MTSLFVALLSLMSEAYLNPLSGRCAVQHHGRLCVRLQRRCLLLSYKNYTAACDEIKLPAGKNNTFFSV